MGYPGMVEKPPFVGKTIYVFVLPLRIGVDVVACALHSDHPYLFLFNLIFEIVGFTFLCLSMDD